MVLSRRWKKTKKKQKLSHCWLTVSSRRPILAFHRYIDYCINTTQRQPTQSASTFKCCASIWLNVLHAEAELKHLVAAIENKHICALYINNVVVKTERCILREQPITKLKDSHYHHQVSSLQQLVVGRNCFLTDWSQPEIPEPNDVSRNSQNSV